MSHATSLRCPVAERIRAEQLPADSPLLGFDCIAVDECQDLTPIEALVIAELAVASNPVKGSPVAVLLAGDEAQTVRATDFERGWLSDILHARITTPAEFKLGANLRSPRKIADLIKRIGICVPVSVKRSGPLEPVLRESMMTASIRCSTGPRFRALISISF